MSGNPVIRAKSVSKAYRLSGPGKSGGLLSSLFGARKEESAEDEDLFWALRDVSLEIPAGSMVGVLGLNGAGKSTFLKIVSGALQPTSGTIERVGEVALIELGAGFNPHQSARENIHTLGRQKGLTRETIEEKVAYVEEFADIGLFFDQPLHTYSSGMRSRVGFGHAFSVDPDILIVDEALSVGDASFANKCFRRIENLRARGKAILFASHDRNAVARLCDMGMVLDHGSLKHFGTAKEAALCYERIVERESSGNRDTAPADPGPAATDSQAAGSGIPRDIPSTLPLAATGENPVPAEIVERFVARGRHPDGLTGLPGYNPYCDKLGSGDAEIVDFLVWPEAVGAKGLKLLNPGSITVLMKVEFRTEARNPVPGILVRNKEGVLLYGSNTILKSVDMRPAKAGDVRIYSFSLDLRLRAQESYFLSLAIADGITQSDTMICDKRESLIMLESVGDVSSTGICDFPAMINEICMSTKTTDPVD